MDRNAKLAAARKKLNQFKRKKGQKNGIQTKPESDASDRSTPEIVVNHDRDITDIKKSEEFIDEKFEMLHCAEDDNDLLVSTAATTESILQVSAKLNGLAAEAEVFFDLDVGMSDEKNVSQDVTENGSAHESTKPVHSLEVRNQELAAKVSSLSLDNQNLEARCQQLNERLHHLQAMIEEEQNKNPEGSHNDALHEQLQVQMQTIGVLVSEKQDLQQELITLKSDLHASKTQQKKSTEDVHAVKEKLVFIERECKTKTASLDMQEKLNSDLQNELEACKHALEQTKYALDSEQVQVSELTGKLQSREMEYHELHSSHADLQEKLGMADVLLQQMSANADGDAVTQLTLLQQEKETLTANLTEYLQAFEQLTTEREQLNRQYVDTQSRWENEFRVLQSQVQILESEKNQLMNDLSSFQDSSQNNLPDEAKSEAGSNAATAHEEESGDIFRVRQQLHEAEETKNLLKDEIASLQGNNQYLSKLVQEKESRIYELENDLEQMKTSVSKQEELLDGSRSDKVTISRALLQNKQLKEQLQEIQEGFIRMSNDKMDLATQVSSLEHGNRDLQACLSQNSTLYQQAKQELEIQKEENIRLQQQNSYMQAHITNTSAQQTNDESDVLNIMQLKLNAAEQSLARMGAENARLKQKSNSLPNGDETIDDSTASLQQRVSETQTSSEVRAQSEYANEDPSEIPNSIMENHVTAMDDVPENIGPMQLGEHEQLLGSMALLQDKFSKVMREKADLLNKLELMEHTNTQLQNECDTIGEYIALYHNQRQILKQRHREKDEYISTIIQEREAMQGKVEQLQTLIVAMLNNQQVGDVGSVTSSPQRQGMLESELKIHETDVSFSNVGIDGSPKQTVLLEQPDLVPKTEVSFIDETNTTDPQSVVPGYSRKLHTSSESSSSEKDHTAASQILTLLEQMQKPIDPSITNKNSVPGGFCMRYIGPYTAI